MSIVNDAYRWVRALNSGQYKQGRGSLVGSVQNEDGTDLETVYCCLGVLCSELGAVDNENFRSFCMIPNVSGYSPSFQDVWINAPAYLRARKVIKALELQQDELADMNDSQRLPFKYLAKVIGERLERLR